MSHRIATRRRAAWILAAVLLAQLLGLGAPVRPLQAATGSPSADPSEELVYLDVNGVIRVIDPTVTAGQPEVQWVSPDAGWRHLSLADVNDDTDLEILAMGQDGASVKIAVFDPVVSFGAQDPNKKINGIPWDTLWTRTFPGVPKFIEGGNFDVGIPGEEFAIGFRDASDNYYVAVYKAAGLGTDGKPTGRDWIEHIPPRRLFPDSDEPDEAARYSSADSGQLDGEGADELVLVDEDSEVTRFDVFKVDADMRRIDGKSSDSDTYKQVAVGQIESGGREEVAVRLSVDRANKPSAIVYEMNGDDELSSDDDWRWAFAPQPEWIFLADIYGNGDEELFILRKYTEDEDGARLLMRDDWGNDRDNTDDRGRDIKLGEDAYDNGYRTGVGGDVDGDSADEVVIMRDDTIRIYTNADFRESSTIEYTGLATDRKTILAGDLDKVGFIEGPQFSVNFSSIDAEVPIGTRSDQLTLQVINNSTTQAVTFNITESPSVAWLELDRVVATTPATVGIRFDATNLQEGIYSTELVLTGAGVLNSPYPIRVSLTVLPATLELDSALDLIHYPCSAPLVPVTNTVRLGGTNGLNYRAAILAVPETASAAGAGSWTGIVKGGELDAAGNMVLTDAAGNHRTIPAPLVGAAGVAASDAFSTTWYVDPAIDWIKSFASDDATVPSNLQIEFEPAPLGDDFGYAQAALILVADTKAGSPPTNVRVIPVTALCVDSPVRLPLVFPLTR